MTLDFARRAVLDGHRLRSKHLASKAKGGLIPADTSGPIFLTCVHVDEAVMGLSVHADGDGEGDNPLLCHTQAPGLRARRLCPPGARYIATCANAIERILCYPHATRV